MDTAEIIKNIRTKLGITQNELAKLIGSEQYNIAKYEAGKTIPPGNVLLKIQELAKSTP